MNTRNGIAEKSRFDCRAWTLEFDEKLTVAVDKWGEDEDQRTCFRSDGNDWYAHGPSIDAAISRFQREVAILEAAPYIDFVSEEEAAEITGLSVDALRKARGDSSR